MRVTCVAVVGLAVGAVLTTVSAARGAQVEMKLGFTAPDGTPLPITPGVGVGFTPGTMVNVVLSVRLQDPFMTASNRNLTTLRDKPLGIASLTVDLVTTGARWFVPVVDVAGPPRQLLEGAYNPLVTPGNTTFPTFVNIEDVNGNGITDVKGTGFTVTSMTPSSSSLLSYHRLGVDGWVDLVMHGYIVNAGASIFELSTRTRELTVFSDPNGTGPLVPVDALSSVIEARVIPFPEPGGVAVVGLAGGVVAGVRRRRIRIAR